MRRSTGVRLAALAVTGTVVAVTAVTAATATGAGATGAGAGATGAALAAVAPSAAGGLHPASPAAARPGSGRHGRVLSLPGPATTGGDGRVVALAADAPNSIGAATRTSPSNVWVGDTLFRVDDSDFFRFSHPRNGHISVWLGDLPSNYYLRLYNSRGGLINTSTNPGQVSEELYGYLPAGTYFARVNLQPGGTVVPASRYVLRFQEFSEGLHYIGPTTAHEAASHNVYIFGQVLNNTSTFRAPVFLTVTWFDGRGRALKQVGGRVFMYVLGPRQRSPFAVNTGPLPAGAVRYTVVARAAVTGSRPAPGVVVRQTSQSNDGTNYHFNGTATNTGTTARHNVRVGVVLYDARGFVRSFSYEASTYALSPRQVHNYAVQAEVVPGVVGVKEYAQASY